MSFQGTREIHLFTGAIHHYDQLFTQHPLEAVYIGFIFPGKRITVHHSTNMVIIDSEGLETMPCNALLMMLQGKKRFFLSHDSSLQTLNKVSSIKADLTTWKIRINHPFITKISITWYFINLKKKKKYFSHLINLMSCTATISNIHFPTPAKVNINNLKLKSTSIDHFTQDKTKSPVTNLPLNQHSLYQLSHIIATKIGI